MKTKEQKIENFLSDLKTDIDVISFVDIDEIDFNYAFDSIRDMIEDSNGFDIEVIYYHDAMDYLREYDPSLNQSLSLASDMGFSLESLNSEILASILKTENVRNDFNDLEDEINSFFEDLEEEEEE